MRFGVKNSHLTLKTLALELVPEIVDRRTFFPSVPDANGARLDSELELELELLNFGESGMEWDYSLIAYKFTTYNSQ